MKRKKRMRQDNASKLDIYDYLFDLVEMDDLHAGSRIDIFMDEVKISSVRVIEDDDGEIEFC